MDTEIGLLLLGSDIHAEILQHVELHELYLLTWVCKAIRSAARKRWENIKRLHQNPCDENYYMLWFIGRQNTCEMAAKTGNLTLFQYAVENQFNRHCMPYDLLKYTVLYKHPACYHYLVEVYRQRTIWASSTDLIQRWTYDIKQFGCFTCKTLHFDYRCPFKNVQK